MLSHIQLFVILWTVARQSPLSMEFSKQEYWSGLPFPIPGDLPDPGIEPTSPLFPSLAGRFFTTAPPRKHLIVTKIREPLHLNDHMLTWLQIMEHLIIIQR